MTQTPSLKTQQMQVGGMDCGSCAAKIEAGVQKIPGVAETSVSFATGRLSVTYDPERVSEKAIRERIKALGYTVESTPTKTFQAQIGGMDCGSCAAKIETSVQKIPGIAETAVSFATGRLSVTYDPKQVSEQEIRSNATRVLK